MKNLDRLALTAIVFVSFIGCGAEDKQKESKVILDTKSEQIVDKKIEKTSSIATNKPFIKKYDIKNGIVEYKIKGNGNIMGMTTKTSGTKRVIFSDYGSRELIEENKIETREINGKKEEIKTHNLVYNKDAVIYKTDFTNKVIKRMKNPAVAMILGSSSEDILKNFGGKKIGTDKILGYKCDIWSIMGSKQCIYKGVVLKVETNVMGIKNIEIATEVNFNAKVDENSFKLPNFPIAGIHKDKSKLEEMDEKAKEDAIKNSEQITQLGHSIKEVHDKIIANPNMSKDERKKVIIESMLNSKNIKSKFQQQKESMPKILNIMKTYKECIASTKSQSDMDSCKKEIQDLNKELGLEDFDVENKEEKVIWSKKNKEALIKEIDKGIKEVSKSMPCMQKSNNMMEFIQCARELK